MWTDEDPEEAPDLPRRLREAPLRTTAHNLVFLTKALVDSFPPNADELHLGPQMLENAFVAAAKLAGAGAFTNYGQLMEQAVLVKLAVQSLLTQTAMLPDLELAHPAHVQALRDEIEHFRKLFVDWVNGFDPTVNDYDDGWGLFPPLIPPPQADDLF